MGLIKNLEAFIVIDDLADLIHSFKQIRFKMVCKSDTKIIVYTIGLMIKAITIVDIPLAVIWCFTL